MKLHAVLDSCSEFSFLVRYWLRRNGCAGVPHLSSRDWCSTSVQRQVRAPVITRSQPLQLYRTSLLYARGQVQLAWSTREEHLATREDAKNPCLLCKQTGGKRIRLRACCTWVVVSSSCTWGVNSCSLSGFSICCIILLLQYFHWVTITNVMRFMMRIRVVRVEILVKYSVDNERVLLYYFTSLQCILPCSNNWDTALCLITDYYPHHWVS